MAPPRGTGLSSSSSPASTAHSLSLLAEYTHTLDSLPLDLSRNFADLRELDAVLSSSTSSITNKITSLTHMIEQGRAPKEERLWLLAEIAEEAARLKLGGEDKIRVACQAADNLKSHTSHMRTLAEHIPGFDANTLNRKTSYPHVAARSFMPTNSLEGGRRRRGGFGSLLVSAPDPSPAKRKRATRDEELDIPHPRSPKKDRNSERNRNGARAKKNERAASPAESLLSVVSHVQQQNNASSSRTGGGSRSNNNTNTNHANATNASSAPNKRARSSASTNNHSNTNGARNSSQAHDHYSQPDAHHSSGTGGNGNSHSGAQNNGNSRRDAFNVPPSSSAHPSLPLPYHPTNGAGAHGHHTHHTIPPGGYDLQHSLTPDWNPPSVHQLEGPGMPVARGSSALPGLGLGHGVSAGMSLSTSGDRGSASANGANGGGTDAGTEAGDGEADGDDKTYCICDTVSYGEMIACDDGQCEKEWFHLTCIGLTVPPEGRWFCESCLARKTAKRSNRGGKRKSAANKAGARAG